MSREVLPNKLGITDPQQLAEYELEVAAARVGEIAGNSRSQRVFFDLMLREAGYPVDWARVDAAAVHAARHVAMRTLDSSFLAAELRPGVVPAAPTASLSVAQARDAERAIELYRKMLAHQES